MRAGAQTLGEKAAGFVAADSPSPFACHVTVAGMDLEGRAAGADAEFDDPLRGLRPGASALLGFRLSLLQSCDLRVDAHQPHGMPHPQGLQTVHIRRQVIEHIFDSMPMILPMRPRVFEFMFDTVEVGGGCDDDQRSDADGRGVVGDACALP
ncbi:hypothetical protein RKD18_007712 [Streptomyces phaeoluteigriseus]